MLFERVSPCAAGRVATLCCALAVLVASCDDDATEGSKPDAAHAKHDAGDANDRDAQAHDAEVGMDARVPADTCAASPALPRVDVLVFDKHGTDVRNLTTVGTSPQQKVTVSGIVEAHGQGQLPAAIVAADPTWSPTGSSYLLLEDGDHEIAIEAHGVPDWGVREGTAIEVQLTRQFAFQGSTLSLLIRTEDGLAFLYSNHESVEQAPPVPEFTLQRGDKLCEASDDCALVGDFALRVDDPDGGGFSLRPGETREQAGLRFAHGDTRVQLKNLGQCADYDGNAFSVSVSRAEPLPAPQFSCERSATSSLSGVKIGFPKDTPCEFTLAQARAGIEILYTVTVDHDIDGFASEPLDIGHCMVPAAGQLGTFETLEGNGQHYALNDVGGCFDQAPIPAVLKQGVYMHRFKWDGVNWSGPSDTEEPKGPPFPPGIYELRITSSGFSDIDPWDADGGSGTPFEASATLTILLKE